MKKKTEINPKLNFTFSKKKNIRKKNDEAFKTFSFDIEKDE